MTMILRSSLPMDSDRGPLILGIAWSTTALACLTVSTPVYTRLKRNAMGWDDYLILVAMVELIKF